MKSKKEQQELALKQKDLHKLTLEKMKEADARAAKDRNDATHWTKADEEAAAALAKKFALTKTDEESTAELAKRFGSISSKPLVVNEISPMYPTGFIPARNQHDDAHRPQALPEMIAGIHARKKDRLSALNDALSRELSMKAGEESEETVRAREKLKQEQLYKEGHGEASREAAVQAGQELVNKLSSAADAMRILEKVDMSGIPIAASLKEAIVGDEQHFRSFERDEWMKRCVSSEVMLDPVVQQVLAITQQISTSNASLWLDVEDAQRRADNAKAKLASAEAALISVLESDDRTKAVVLLEQVRKQRSQRAAEAKAVRNTASDTRNAALKVSLLQQQRQALRVLSHAEEAEALGGDARRIQLNKAASDAQKAANEEEKSSERGSSKYVPRFKSVLLETAAKPWSLSAQENVQSLLGSISTKILAAEHTERDRATRLSVLESKVNIMLRISLHNRLISKSYIFFARFCFFKDERIESHLTYRRTSTGSNEDAEFGFA